MPYSSSLSDAEWAILERQREIIDGILYQLKNGCNWQELPRGFPPYSTVYWHYKQWRDAGVFDQLMETLHGEVRLQAKKK